MKVGIIGYKGFVGSAFFEAFSGDGRFEVVGIDRQNYQFHVGKQFDLIINANGNSSKRLADAEPEKDFEMNVGATLRIIRDFPCEGYIHLSTIEVYEQKGSQESTKEDTPIDSLKLSNYGFSKLMAEFVARKHTKRWMILRLGGMVGKNMKKGPAYDILNLHKLFVSPKSEYHFMNTEEVASIAKALVERGKWGEIYNVVGDGSVSLEKFAQMAGVRLEEHGTEIQKFNVQVGKLKKEFPVSASKKTVEDFVKSYRAGSGFTSQQ